MDFELFIILSGILLMLGSGFVSWLEKIKKRASNRSPEELLDLNHEKRFAAFAFVVVIVGAILALYSGIHSWKDNKETKKENKILSDSLFRTQSRLENIARLQLDTALSILSLTHDLNMAQSQLTDAQRRMIDFQKYSLEQITGGQNKPIVFFEQSPKYSSEINLGNAGKNYIRNIDAYIKIKNWKIDSTSSTVNVYDVEACGSFESWLFVENSDNTKHINIINLEPGGQRVLYKQTLPQDIAIIHYLVNVVWNNGAYEAQITGRVYNKRFYIKNIDYFVDGKKITDQVSYFGMNPLLPSLTTRCESINYGGNSYDVYWRKKDKAVYALKPGSIIPIDLGIAAFSKEMAPLVLHSRFVELFGYQE
jgi:hypothetical protein